MSLSAFAVHTICQIVKRLNEKVIWLPSDSEASCSVVDSSVIVAGRRGHRGGVVFDDGGGDGEQPRISGRTAAATELITYDRGIE